MSFTLTVIIISHNQKEEFRRCIDSILAMDLSFEHEIIVSDDASTDGTWELAKEYEASYPGVIKVFQCNSNDCNPANTSHRSGWNRCNAYPHASGKYIAHVDADDYFRPGADVYRRQVEALEQHPECSMALSNILCIDDGQDLSKAKRWHKDGIIKEGRILTGKQFIDEHLFILNQAFIQRRNPDANPVELYGRRYVDSVITFHHLQFGPVVCVDACDYIYVNYQKSVTGEMCRTKDTNVLWCLGLYIPALIPAWRHDYFIAEYSSIRRVIRMARSGYALQEKNKNSLNGLGVYIYDTFNRPLTVLDKCRLGAANFYMRVMHKFGWNSKLSTDLMYLLLCKE